MMHQVEQRLGLLMIKLAYIDSILIAGSGSPGQGGRFRRRGASRRKWLPGQPIPGKPQQPAHRRLRRQRREAQPVRAGGNGRDGT